jgi:hypothetical protein
MGFPAHTLKTNTHHEGWMDGWMDGKVVRNLFSSSSLNLTMVITSAAYPCIIIIISQSCAADLSFEEPPVPNSLCSNLSDFENHWLWFFDGIEIKEAPIHSFIHSFTHPFFEKLKSKEPSVPLISKALKETCDVFYETNQGRTKGFLCAII